MLGKKSNKLCITVSLMCNKTGTMKWPIFYIGREKQPRCFGKKQPSDYGFQYHHNKMAWMTSAFFEEWLKEADQHFCSNGQHVTLTINNFLGHMITYKPTNIELIYFESNLTPYVQPLDAGIIRCFKAHYCKAFCSHTIDMDYAGEEDIYRIYLLEIMLMVRQAWDAVTPQTIENCWQHTSITH